MWSSSPIVSPTSACCALGHCCLKVLPDICDFFFRSVITFLNKTLLFVLPFLTHWSFLLVAFQAQRAFQARKSQQSNAKHQRILVYMAKRSCSKSFPLKSEIALYSMRYLTRSSTPSRLYALTFGAFLLNFPADLDSRIFPSEGAFCFVVLTGTTSTSSSNGRSAWLSDLANAPSASLEPSSITLLLSLF